MSRDPGQGAGGGGLCVDLCEKLSITWRALGSRIAGRCRGLEEAWYCQSLSRVHKVMYVPVLGECRGVGHATVQPGSVQLIIVCIPSHRHAQGVCFFDTAVVMRKPILRQRAQHPQPSTLSNTHPAARRYERLPMSLCAAWPLCQRCPSPHRRPAPLSSSDDRRLACAVHPCPRLHR